MESTTTVVNKQSGAPGLEVIDVSNPSKLRRVGGNSTVGSTLAFEDDYAITVAGNELATINLFRFPGRLEAIPPLNRNDFKLRIRGSTGETVFLQRSSNLRDWQDWKPVTLGSNGDLITDPEAADTWRFYRTR